MWQFFFFFFFLQIEQCIDDPVCDASCLAVHTVRTVLFDEPRAGKGRAERLEEDSRSYSNCRHVYSLWLAQQL